MNEEVARFLADGPTPAELQRVKTGFRADFVRGIERIGGFGGKSDVLAQGEVWAGRPDFYKTRLQRVAGATAAQIRATANRWLADGDYTLEVLPYGEYQVAAAGVDRSKLPESGTPPDAKFPAVRARHPRPTASRSCSRGRRRSPRCASACCSTPATPPISSAFRARRA